MDERLNRIEASVVFRFLRFAGRILAKQKKIAGQILLHSPFHPLYLRLRGSSAAKLDGVSYGEWVAARESRGMTASWYRQQARGWRVRPLVSVVMSTFRPQRMWLERAIESVKAQSYEQWQLCICDDASGEPWIREYLESEAAANSRIRVSFRGVNGGISEGLNVAGQLATGEYAAFLDHDDELHPQALFHIVEACQDGADVLYSDEDYLDPDGQRSGPTFKPDWSPELLDSCMYFGHLFVARRELIEQVGWFRKKCDGAQDYDLALRLVERAREVRHVRQVLYHWRQHAQSTSLNPAAKPYAHEAGRIALADAMARRQVAATIEDGPLLYTFYIQPSLRSKRPASLIVCTRNAKRLAAFLEGRKKTARPHELVVVEHVVSGGEPLGAVLDSTDCVRVRYSGVFNFSKMCNLGAEGANGELLVFINDDVTPIRPEWLDVMADRLENPEIGMVGARLLYPSGALQHSGMVFGIQDGAGHPGRGEFGAAPLMYSLQLPRNVSAVTGACLGIRKNVFQEIGGFDPAFPDNYGDLDLCLRVRKKGYRIVVDPRIELTHVECATRKGGTTFAERQRFRLRWSQVLVEGDPYFPEAFDRTTEKVRLAAF